MRRWLAVYLVAALFGVPAVAGAATITFNTSDSQFDAGVDNQGWWSVTGIASDASPSYLTGDNGDGDLLRSFFTFDLSALNLAGQTLLSATFEAVRYSYVSPDATETIGFFDVSTDATTLNNNVGTSAPIFADLGSGTSYGSFVVPAYAFSTDTLTFSLNAAALADIAAAAGGFFSIGGSLQSITPGGFTELMFANSGGSGIQRLILDIEPTAPSVPEPTSLLLLGTGLIGAGGRRYRQRR